VWLEILEPCLEGKSDGYMPAFLPLIVALIMWCLCRGFLQFALKALYSWKQVGMLLPVRDVRALFVGRTDSHSCRIGGSSLAVRGLDVTPSQKCVELCRM